MGWAPREPGGLRAGRHRQTFFLEALGQKVIEAGMPVAWFTLEQIGVLVRAHRADDSLGKAVAKIVRAELVVIDDVGLLPVGADAAEGLYRIVEAAYERRSVAISSNLHPSGFDELMPKTLATATVDRLLHHAHLCQNQRRLRAAGPSPARERSQTPDLTPANNRWRMHPHGQIRVRHWAVLIDHLRAFLMSAHGQFQLSIDRFSGKATVVRFDLGLCDAIED